MNKQEVALASEQPDGDELPRAERDVLFVALVREHRARLHRFIWRHIGHYEDANDIVQQAFVAASQAIERFRGEAELSTWLYGIAMNLVRNYLSRSPNRRYTFESDDKLEGVPGVEHEEPSAALARQQLLRELANSMAELPKSMQEVLMLVAVDEMPYEEAAAVLCVPVGTVRSRLSRARSVLRSKLAEAGVDSRFLS
ncbi:RNA polymerase sigma factor [Variovorax sp. KK3]|uniref:RNA polymerase sigma factor n=1 Tax=Variovorax sp. KK3 TaxID=1855728 RepID=UPI00097C906A|nr:RNA polymerase sigma factor [Variovorax sp. KK3]